MSDEIVTLGTFANTFEAEMAKNRLADEGIPSFVTGETSGIFAGMTNLFGEVQLLVAEKNLERARTILEEEPEDEPAAPEREPHVPESNTSIKAPEWAQEPPAKSESKAGAAVQAAPGTKETTRADADSRAGQPTTVPDRSVPPSEPAPGPAGKAASKAEPAVQAASLISSDAAPAPANQQGKGDEEEEEYRITWSADDYAARAWKAAIIGFFALPPVLHFYSLWCLIRLFSMDEDLSPSGTRKLYGALAIDTLVFTFISLLCCGLVGIPFR